MKGIFRKDLFYIVQNMRLYLVIVMIFTVGGFLQNAKSEGTEIGFLPLVFVYGAMIPHIVMMQDTQTRFLTPLGGLPVSRRAYLAEKYLLALGAMAVMAVYAFVMTCICGLISGHGVGAGEIAALLANMSIGLLFPAVSILVWSLVCDKDKNVYTICSVIMGGFVGLLIGIMLTFSGKGITEPDGAGLMLLISAGVLCISFCISTAVFKGKDIQ